METSLAVRRVQEGDVITTHRFNVGDRIRVVRYEGRSSHVSIVGLNGVVVYRYPEIGVAPYYAIRIGGNQTTDNVFEDEIEPLEPKKDSK